jgi:hypothetical protein
VGLSSSLGNELSVEKTDLSNVTSDIAENSILVLPMATQGQVLARRVQPPELGELLYIRTKKTAQQGHKILR